jgi:uncharacterized protein (TIGR02466 family)
MNKTDLFPTTIFHSKAKCHNEVKNYIDKYIYPVYKKNGYNSNQCAVFSDYFEGAPQLDQKVFNDFYRENIEELLNEVGFDNSFPWTVASYFWYNITGKGGWQEQHDHISGPLPCQFSAVHYLKFDETHVATEFENPVAALLRSMAPTDQKDMLPVMFKSLQATPNFIKEGDIIFFPAYLKHAVKVQESENERISIVFNIGVYNNRFIINVN